MTQYHLILIDETCSEIVPGSQVYLLTVNRKTKQNLLYQWVLFYVGREHHRAFQYYQIPLGFKASKPQSRILKK